METLYFPRGPARQPGSSGMAGALQLSHRDDYYYGTEAHLVWQQTGSIPQAISAACAVSPKAIRSGREPIQRCF